MGIYRVNVSIYLSLLAFCMTRCVRVCAVYTVWLRVVAVIATAHMAKVRTMYVCTVRSTMNIHYSIVGRYYISRTTSDNHRHTTACGC